MTMAQPEFSHPVKVDSLPDKETNFKIEANPQERQALAERFGLVSLQSLMAEVTVCRRKKGRLYAVKGKMTASLTQQCVITLEPLNSDIACDFEVLFSEEEVEQEPEKLDELVIDMQDLPELIVEGIIDIGEVVAEQLSLEIDQFPRKDDAIFENDYNQPKEGVKQDDSGQKRDNPFDVLADFKKKLEKDT